MTATPGGTRCPGPEITIQPIGPGLWQLPAHDGDAAEANRGAVSNLVLARHGRQWWLLGSGPSPAHGQAVACRLRQRLGAVVTDVVSPWARPELVLGVAGLQAARPTLRHWAHAEVADAMRVQCPVCVERLRLRLGGAADDLGAQPIALPGQRLQGTQGRLGPFDWWLLPRADGRWVTVWRHAPSALWVAHGLLAAAPPGDGRDADLLRLRDSLRSAARLAAVDGPAVRWLGEQGGPQGASAPVEQARYWDDLDASVRQAIDQGVDESMPPAAMPAWPGVSAHPWHALNWQRAWRQAEERQLGAAPK
ncbi:hypothetical protein [Ideonella sp. A 288]|uniref:hypothetical protein n=1 Tax=Ideonella sp. A 288 TaxID=1962181 RepID=UPI0011858469|nr:hypothetical protein [Ideonella sp. A 288]